MSCPPASADLPEERRDWAGLPRDLLLDVFLKLGPVDIMMGAEYVCTAWRRVAVEEPALWRRIATEEPAPWLRIGWDREKQASWRREGVDQLAMARVALPRAAGQCQAFDGYCDADLLSSLLQSAPSLERLDLGYQCDYASIQQLILALSKLPLLVHLALSFSDVIKYAIDGEDILLHSVCEACPQLKELEVDYVTENELEYSEDFRVPRINRGMTMMCELRSLRLYECDLSVKGLHDILDHCPLLESLDVAGYFNKHKMGKKLLKKCARVKNITLHTNSSGIHNEHYYDFNSSTEDDDDYSEDDSQEE